MTGTTTRALADAYTAASGKPGKRPLGFNHAIYEVALDVVKRAADLSDPAAIVAVAQGLRAVVNPGWQVLAGHIAFILVLAVRPRGLFPAISG